MVNFQLEWEFEPQILPFLSATGLPKDEVT